MMIISSFTLHTHLLDGGRMGTVSGSVGHRQVCAYVYTHIPRTVEKPVVPTCLFTYLSTYLPTVCVCVSAHCTLAFSSGSVCHGLPLRLNVSSRTHRSLNAPLSLVSSCLVCHSPIFGPCHHTSFYVRAQHNINFPSLPSPSARAFRIKNEKKTKQLLLCTPTTAINCRLHSRLSPSGPSSSFRIMVSPPFTR